MDVKDTTLDGLKRALRAFLQDLEALPEAAFNKSLGGKARPVADIVYEVNLYNDQIGSTLRGESSFDWPEYDPILPEEARTKDAAIQAFKTSSERVLATVEALTAEDLEATILVNNGETPYTTDWMLHGVTTGVERCRFMTTHVWYHCGQLNYIQALLGDAQCHWA